MFPVEGVCVHMEGIAIRRGSISVGGYWRGSSHIYIRDMYPGLETACAANRMLGNKKQLMSVILVINSRLAK